MYILTNSLKNLIRNKGRNILIIIIMIAILSSTGISIIINTTSNEIIKDYKNRFGAEVFIQPNMEKTEEKIANGQIEDLNKGVPNDIKEQIAKSEYIKDAIFNLTFSGYSNEIKALDQSDRKDDIDMSNVIAIGDSQSNLSKIPNLNILGGLSVNANDEFKNGTRKVVEGKVPDKNNEAIISEEFAKLNNLSVGDTIKIKNPVDIEKFDSLNLTISGIYYDGAKSNNFGVKHPMLNRSNEIITTYETLKSYDEKLDNNSVNMDVKYYLKNPDMLESFNEEAHKLGLSDLFDLSVDATSYNNIVKPVEGLKSISNIFMVLVLGFGGSILILISILAIRERKYEIGVLRAMGMKKIKVGLGLISESILMIFISLSIGITLASISAQPISDILLKEQLQSQKQNSLSSVTIGASGQGTTSEVLEALNVSLNSEAIFIIIAIALLLGVISASIGIIYINRYEPRKILTERN